MTNTSPGWYPDPEVPQQMRWWEGERWSADTYQRVEPFEDWTATGTRGPVGPSGPQGPAGSTVEPAGRAGGPSTPDGVRLAGWWPRAAARVVDTLLTSLVSYAIGFGLLASATGPALEQARTAARSGQAVPRLEDPQDPATLRAFVVLSLIWLAVTLAYDLVFLPRHGATPGKFLLGLRVRRWEPDQPLTAGRVGVRWLTSSGLSSVRLGGLGLVYGVVDAARPLWHPRRQALHDRFAGTCVVRAARRDVSGTSI